MNGLQSLRNIGKGDSQEDALVETLYIIMKKFKYTLEELKKIPLPTMMMLVKMINKEHDQERRSSRRMK